eukprot:1169552-Pleurochrysis_carterae.AAC.4
MELLPPLAVDGNLHTSYSMWGNAYELRETEDVLAAPAADTTPALLLIRQWTARMEVDLSEWRAETVAPIGMALAHNPSMLAFRVAGARQLGRRIDKLAPMLAANTTLLSLTIDDVGAEPSAMEPLCAALASNDLAALSVINLSHNALGDGGASQLANALRRLRP